MNERARTLQSLVRHDGLGLEISPFHNPVFPKSQGFNVETADYFSTDRLRELCGQMGLDPTAVEPVDYVLGGLPLHEAIPRRGEYDFIFSSHVIEHVPDVIGHLKSCEMLLKPDGILLMVVPDKRYIFDGLRPHSTTGSVIQAHTFAHTHHYPSAIFDFFADYSALEGQGVWSRHSTGSMQYSFPLSRAQAEYEGALRKESSYADVHGWMFTPSSFRMIIQDLHEMGVLALKEIGVLEIGMLEFHVTLSRQGAGSGLDRIQLQKKLLREQLAFAAQILAADDPEMAALHQRLTG